MATFTSFDGTSLFYLEEGDGPPAVLLHGLTSSTEGNWRRPGIWNALLDAGKRVIGLDARGHGRSDKAHDPRAYEREAMVRDVASLFDHVGLGTADLAGYSMGAFTAIRFAAQDTRVRRLVLGGIGGDPGQWGAPEAREERGERAKRILAGLTAADAASIEDPLARRVRQLMEERGNDLEAMAAIQLADRPVIDSVETTRVSAPTLVVCGEDDVSPDPLAAVLPAGQALVLTGDHEGVVSNPELGKVIAAFLSEE